MERDCERVRERLADDVAGDLAPAEADAVRRHVARCPACAQVRRRLEAIFDAAGRFEDPPLRAGFAEAVMARLTLARVARARPTRWVRVAAVAAVLLVAVSAVLLMRRPPKKDDRPANAEGVEAFVAGLDGATRRAGRTGAGALAAFADAGRQMLTATPVTAPSVEAPALESVVQEGSVALGQDVEAVGRAVRVMLSEVEGSIPWL